MQWLRWRCHSKLLQWHRTKLKYLNMTNSPSNARFSWQKSCWTGSASAQSVNGDLRLCWQDLAVEYSSQWARCSVETGVHFAGHVWWLREHLPAVYHLAAVQSSGTEGDHDCCKTSAGGSGKLLLVTGVVRIGPLHFLAGCRTRRLNQV